MEPIWLKKYPKGRRALLDESSYLSIPHFFSDVCKQFGKNKAFTCLGTSLSYSKLSRLSDHFASFLQNELGLQKGDRIAVVLPNIIQFPIVFLAIQKAGLVLVSTNPQYTPSEMLHQFKDSGAKAIVILDLFLDKLEPIIEKTHLQHVITTQIGDQFNWVKSKVFSLILKYKMSSAPITKLSFQTYSEALEKGAKKRLIPPQLALNDIALLQYTGGTTGVSKGAILTHGNILSNIRQIHEWINPDLKLGKETVLSALPLFHIFGLTVNCLVFLARGDRLILIPRPIPIENTVKAFKKYRITIVLGVNTLFNALNNSKAFRQLAPKTIKFALAGGMALQESVASSWEKITGNRLLQGFGLTETSPVTHIVPLSEDFPSGSIGVPIPSTFARIVDERGFDLPLGEPGELIIQGPQVMRGYWNHFAETHNSLKDGWLHTGDIARMDSQGFFYIVDRKKDMIVVSGFNVYPNEVESVISLHPKVLEVAVVGAFHKASGECVKAFVVRKDASLTESEIKLHCRQLLASYKLPRMIEFRDSLPKTIVGKILRRELKTIPSITT